MEFLLRETGQIVRGRGTAWRRLVFILAACVVTFFAITAGTSRFALTPGRDGFVALMTVNVYFLFTITSSFFSKAVSGEREEGTLDLLSITGLSPQALIMSKGLSQYFRACLLILAQVPLCVLCIVLGGVSPGRIGAVYFLFGAVVFFVSQNALYWSVVSKTSRAAFHNTVGICLCLYVLPYLVLFLQSLFPGLMPAWVLELVNSWARLNPFMAFKSAMASGDWPVASIVSHFLAGAISLVLAAFRFERSCMHEQVKAAGAIASPKAVKRRGPIPRVGVRPLAWKEYYFMAGGWYGTRFRWLAHLVTGAALTFLVTRGKNWGAEEAMECGGFFFGIGLICVISEVAFAATKMFGVEVTQRTLGDLVVLPVSTRRIVFEKALGHLPCVLPAAAMLTLGSVLLGVGKWGWLEAISHSQRWIVAAYVVMQCFLLLLLTIRLSLRLPTSAFAVTFSLLMYANVLVFGMLSEGFDIPVPAVTLAMGALSVVLVVHTCKSLPDAIAKVAAK